MSDLRGLIGLPYYLRVIQYATHFLGGFGWLLKASRSSPCTPAR